MPNEDGRLIQKALEGDMGAFGELVDKYKNRSTWIAYNMVGNYEDAREVSQEAFGYALIVDSVNYTLWVMLLLFLVPFAHLFNKFTKSDENVAYLGEVGCACSMGATRYWLLILFALVASIVSQMIALNIDCDGSKLQQVSTEASLLSPVKVLLWEFELCVNQESVSDS